MINSDKFLPWTGEVYSSWGEAVSSAGDFIFNFESNIWIDATLKQLKNYTDLIEKNGIYTEPVRPNNLPIIATLTKAQNIVDYGGGSGWLHFATQLALPTSYVEKYIILENIEVVNYYKRSNFFETNKSVEFQCYDGFKKTCNIDIFYCNSVLQYHEDNEELAEVISVVKPKFLFFEDLIANENSKDYFGLQKYYGKFICYRFIGLNNFCFEMEKLGYKLIMQTPYLSPHAGRIEELPMDNFPIENRIPRALSLLFELDDEDR
jgi:putative methyltransferase (TIGR04325 family)